MQINFSGFTKGENSNISPLLHPSEQPKVLNNCTNTWKVGSLTKDTGYSIKGAQIEANKSIGGLFNFIQVPGTEKMLATVDDATSDHTQLFYSTGTTWTEITGAETAWANHAGMSVEMESFIGYCFFVGYGATDGFMPSASLTGTTFSTSTCVTSMPEAKYIKRYRDRVYIANCNIGATTYPFRVYYSSVPSGGAITWTVATDFLDVDYSDQITGMTENWDKLIIFTEYKAYMYDQTSWKKVWDYGCSNHRTIRNSGAYTFFANNDGVWLTTGGQPQNIAGEIMDFIRAGTPRNFFAEIVDEEYWLYIGTVTVDGISYSNCVKIFNIPLAAWRTRELSDTATVFAKYNSSGVRRLWFGTNNGQVMDKGKYTDATLVSTDNTADIPSNFELAPIYFNDLGKIKRLNSIVAHSKKGNGLKLFARAVDAAHRKLTIYEPIGELTDTLNHFEIDIPDAVMFQIAGSENGSREYWQFDGFELDVELYSQLA